LIDVLFINKYKIPTPIQAQSWPYILTGKNLIGIA